MPVDDAPVLTDPVVVQNRLYLRSADGLRVTRLPSPPLPMTADGAVAATFGLYRYSDGDFGGGGALAVTLDLGSPWDLADQADAALPPHFQAVEPPQHASGWVRLWFGPRELAKARLTPGTRPVVPMAARLDQDEATMVRAMIDGGAGTALAATAGGSLVVDGAGVSADAAVDVEAVRRAVAGAGPLRPDEVADAVADLLHAGAVRISTTDPAPDDALLHLAAATVAAALFDPVPTAEPWSLVPGLRLPGYGPPGALRLRRRLRRDLSLRNGTRLPWLAAAPLPLATTAATMWDLPSTRVAPLAFLVNGPWPADLADLGVEVRVGDEPTAVLPLSDEIGTLRLLPPPDWSGEYRWRVTGSTPDGTRRTTAWVTTEHRNVILTPENLSLTSDETGEAER